MMVAPSPEALRRIVAQALRAPSGDNCQPWRFHFDGRVLAVHHVAERAHHWLDHASQASRLTLGCVLESLAVAATAEGLVAEATFEKGAGPWATVRFVRAPARVDVSPLAAAIEQRCTDRRPFRPGWLPRPLVEALLADAASLPGVRLRFVHKTSPELLGYLADCDELVLRHEPVHRHLMRWVRFEQVDPAAPGDGMPWQTLGVSFLESRALKMSRNYAVQRVMNELGVVRQIRSNTRKLVGSSAAIGCVTIDAASDEGLTRGGQLTMRAWLRLAQAGFGFQPLTVPALLAYSHAARTLPDDTPPRFVELFRGGAGVLRRAFGFGEDELPVWMFRTGVSAGPLRVPTQRLAVEAVLTMEAAALQEKSA